MPAPENPPVTQSAADILCLSHLPWDFVYQRPNHLMARAARGQRVFFIQEPYRGAKLQLEVERIDGLTVVRPAVPATATPDAADVMVRRELDCFLEANDVRDPWLWYYTPMALRWTSNVRASAVIYDCMDELSNFKLAPTELRVLERELLQRADVVFTGGRSLYEAKRNRHARTYLFPSSVDGAHFGQARGKVVEPADQARIGRPRIGYYGVIDERIDLELLAEVAQRRPDWNLVMVGPLAKIADEDLPRNDNIHWLGLKPYDELPAYLAGWDVAIMPFALNESTRYISPTKTPEYLAGGRPVVSTPITDVVRPYGEQGLVHIAADAEEFVAAVEEALQSDPADLLRRADAFLASQSWDATWAAMESLVRDVPARRRPPVTRERAIPALAMRPRTAVASTSANLAMSAARTRPR
jgi:glycosyltransferase involved in cell wall biosynthesis